MALHSKHISLINGANFAKLLKWLRQSINGPGSASKVLHKHYTNVRHLALGYLAFASDILSLR